MSASGAGAGPSSMGAAAAAAAACAGGCFHCGAPRTDEAWAAAFGVALCRACKQQDSLISKSKAKSMFLLSDADLRPLGTLERSNPQNKSWAPMRMYLASQVRAAAVRKHGSLSAIEATKEEREDRRFAAAAEARKRGAAAEAEAEREEAQFAARVEARAAKLAREAEAAQQGQLEAIVDPETGAIKRARIAPQLAEVDVEEI